MNLALTVIKAYVQVAKFIGAVNQILNHSQYGMAGNED